LLAEFQDGAIKKMRTWEKAEKDLAIQTEITDAYQEKEK
jgi:hypothetical protein